MKKSHPNQLVLFNKDLEPWEVKVHKKQQLPKPKTKRTRYRKPVVNPGDDIF